MASKKDKHQEIGSVRGFVIKNQVITNVIDVNLVACNLIPVELKLKERIFVIYVLDEYEDLSYKNNLLDTVLVLRELELLQESIDFLDWCKKLGLAANNDKLRCYYIDIIKVIPEIKEYFPSKKITSFFSDLDFQLNSGEISLLRKY